MSKKAKGDRRERQYDNEGWRIKKLEDDGWTQILDERDRSCNFGEATVELFSS